MSKDRIFKLDALCLVFATQRSGSTAFSRAIKQTGIFGRPRELLLETQPKSRRDVLKMFEDAEFPTGSRTSGAKLMIGDIVEISQHLTGRNYGNDLISAVRDLMAELGALCELACFAILRDDPIAIATSVGFAHCSGVWHLDEHQDKEWSDREIDAVAQKALEALPRILREIKQLKELKESVPNIIWFDYDDCAQKGFRIGDDILERCQSVGIKGGGLPSRDAAIPDKGMYKKIVHQKDQARVQNRLAELGVDEIVNV